MNLALAIGLFLIALSMTKSILQAISKIAQLGAVERKMAHDFAGGVAIVAVEVAVLVLAGMRLL